MKQFFLSCLLLILTGLSFSLYSQTPVRDSVASTDAYVPTTALKIGFVGALLYPGCQFALERPYQYTEVTKQRQQKVKRIYKERYIRYALGIYSHYRYHTNFFLQCENLQRRQKSTGWWFESSEGVGVSRTFVNGPAYTVSDEGAIHKATLAGNWYALVSVGGSVGYNFNLKKHQPFSVYCKHQWLVLFPYNTLFLPRPLIEMGLTCSLSHFWQAHPVKKSKIISSSK